MRKRLILIAALPLSISLKPLAAQNEKIFIIDKQTIYQEIEFQRLRRLALRFHW